MRQIFVGGGASTAHAISNRKHFNEEPTPYLAIVEGDDVTTYRFRSALSTETLDVFAEKSLTDEEALELLPAPCMREN